MTNSVLILTFETTFLSLSLFGAPAGTGVVIASGLVQKCLGITPGADKMTPGPATRQYCRQLPGADLFDQAGARFQSGDHAGAAQILGKAAQAGNVEAQLRLALMYDQGDGVARSSKSAFAWYSRAAAQGNRIPEPVGSILRTGRRRRRKLGSRGESGRPAPCRFGPKAVRLRPRVPVRHRRSTESPGGYPMVPKGGCARQWQGRQPCKMAARSHKQHRVPRRGRARRGDRRQAALRCQSHRRRSVWRHLPQFRATRAVDTGIA